jgi:HD-GYP domain-containing protein (c-di-GMP phosphodiesterase class II)
MPTKTIEIEVERLKIGMYVAELDRPWLDTPFLFQGFRITENEEVEQLRRLCKKVRVDITIGDPPDPVPTRSAPPPSTPAEAVQSNEIFRSPARGPIANKEPIDDELPKAQHKRVELARTLEETMNGLRSGRVLSVERLQATSTSLIDSIERNPDALAWLTTMRSKDAGMYRHAMAVAVLVLTCGRHLGLPRPGLESMALGGLLFDVGKTRVSDTVLMKPDRLTEAEFERFKAHVQHGIEILTGCRGVDEAVLSMVRTHHERHDGSGYPLGLKGDTIPALGKIVGICDVYQTMLDSPTAGRRLSPHDVLNYLNGRRGTLFDAALVEEFIQAIGIYPTGTFVRLSDGSVGVVYEQNRLRRLLPRVMLVLDGTGVRLKPFQMVDLMMQSASEDRSLRIVECLDPGSCGLDVDDLFL